MKKFLPILFFFFLPLGLGLHAQSLSVNTTRFVGGDSSCAPSASECNYTIQTRDGGILFVGFTNCYSGGGDIPPNFADATGDGGNVLIGKLDSNMNVSWVKVYGGTQLDIATSAIQTPDGGYAVLGYTGSNDHDASGNHGTQDLWLVRIDSLGNLLWQHCYGSPADEQSGSIALTPDNGFIMFGISNGSGDDVPAHYGSGFNENWFVVKTDSAGNKQWTKTIGGTGGGSDGGEQQYGSIFYADNGYYLVSASNSTDHDCTDTFWHPGVNTGYDYYIFKLDTAGNILWDSSYGGGGSDVAFQAIWDNKDSSIVINGSTTSNNYMITGNHGGSDMGVMKIDKNGIFKWAKCLGSPNNESGNSICTSSLGYMAYGSTSPGSVGHENAWLFALDSFGNQITDTVFGGLNYDYSSSVLPFQNGYIASGYSNSDSFTVGTNVGRWPGIMSDAFFTYINYLPLKVDDITGSEQIALYPNPTNGKLRIVYPDQTGNLNIINCIGQSIYSIIIKQNEWYTDINTTGWADGVYIVRWYGEDGTVLTKKFIKN